MAAFRQSRAAFGVHGTSLNLAFNGGDVLAGSAIVVYVRKSGTASQTPTVTDNHGDTFVVQTAANGFNAGSARLYCFVAENAVGASTTVTIDWGVTDTTMRWAIVEYSGVPTSGVVENATIASFTAGTAISSNNVTSVGSDSLIAGMVGVNSATTSIGPNGSETERVNSTDVFQVEDVSAGAPGTYNLTWLLGNAQSGGYVVLSLKSSGTPAGGVRLPYSLSGGFQEF